MPAPMKKRLTNQEAKISWNGTCYRVPIKILEKYKVADGSLDNDFESISHVFGDLINEFGEPGVILKGLRTKEGKTQVQFAKMIDITQENLSAMENGRRAIGKILAKRIGEKFKVNYKLFL